MKTNYFIRIAVMIACTGLFFACSKSSSSGSNSTTTTVSNLETQSDDQAMVTNEDEAMTDDADAGLESNASIAGTSVNAVPVNNRIAEMGVNGIDSTNLICDATISVDTTSSIHSVTITYNGSNCLGNRTRTGSIVISVPAGVHWGDVGATVTIAINNLKITRASDGKSIIFNGTKTLTNVSGGLLINLATLQTITHTVTDTMSITFNNGSTRTWNFAKQRVYTYNNGVVVTTTGTHSDGTNSDVAEWGTNRFGVSFESLITTPKVVEQSCDFRLVSGANEIMNSNGVTATITYGLNASGVATGCPGTGYYYAELVYVSPAGKTYTYIFPY